MLPRLFRGFVFRAFVIKEFENEDISFHNRSGNIRTCRIDI